MTDAPELTITVSNRLALVTQVARQIGLLVSGSLTLAGFVRHRDLLSVLTWMRGDDVLPFLTAAVTLSIAAYGLLRTMRAKRCLIRAAFTPPDKVELA